MLEKMVVSYGYIPESKIMRAGSSKHTDIKPPLKEENSWETQQPRNNSKRNSRRRVVESRNVRRFSDAGSDTGSDGVAVNSGGSGRSGDWGPPKLRPKTKYSRKRSEQRASFTDSGISLAKTDSGDFSELSNQASPIYDIGNSFDRKEYEPYSDSSHERNKIKHITKLRANSEITQPQDRYQRSLITRSSSCSALPSNIKPIDKHNPRISNCDVIKAASQCRENIDIMSKETAILQQCFRNEGISSDCIRQDCCYVADCGGRNVSKFPLPQRLNYPLNKYYKSETSLNRLHIQPLKKLRSSIRKLKSKTSLSVLSTPPSTPKRYEHYTASFDDTIDTLDSNYLNSLTQIESSEDIMARLAKNPNSRKTWIKKFFKWRLGKSYTPKSTKESIESPVIYSESPRKISNLRLHSSTRSIPDAIKGMWNKLHEKPCTNEFQFTRPIETLTRASSMPSISTHRISKQKIGDVIYFHEKGFEETENKNIFQNFFKPIEIQSPKQTPLKGGNDIITSVIGGNPSIAMKDAELSDAEEKLYSAYENNNGTGPIPITQQYYKSCEDIRGVHNSLQSCVLAAGYSQSAQCPCCGHSQNMPQEQFAYPYDKTNLPMVKPAMVFTKPANVIAPLDVKVSSERRAERRKICEMVFDTFV